MESGYYRIAKLMGDFQDTSIFRRFDFLNMMNLLSLQAELVDLQRQLKALYTDPQIYSSLRDEEKAFLVDFKKLHDSQDSRHMNLMRKIREVLQQYNTALIQVVQIQKLPTPDEESTRVLREWIGENAKFLDGPEAFTWSLRSSSSKEEQKHFNRQLVTTFTSANESDMFSTFLEHSLLKIWSFFRYLGAVLKCNTSSSDNEILEISEETLIRINNIIISVISAVMPVIVIIALFFIKTEGGRIGAMAGFTIVFALILAVFTNARRLEIAASTAAFAAVEVVFIGSDLGKSQLAT